MEDWRVISSFPNYSVNRVGQVRNDDTGRYMALLVNSRGIVNVGLTKGKTQYKRSLSVIVASTFLPPHEPTFSTPINLDGERMNNCADNLMWRPRWFAIRYYQQFRTQSPSWVETPIEETKTHEYFDNSFDAVMKYGLLTREILLSAIHGLSVFPTSQTFRFLQ